jgi:DNA helicase-2/ATP-dependent DNA helicase PcrA
MQPQAISDTPTAAAAKPAPNLVQPGSPEHVIIQEEQALLANIQKALADQQIGEAVASEWDRELVSLRDQIAEARLEDVAPLVAEMYRLQAVGTRSGSGRSLPVDPSAPYFGHLRLMEGKKTRDVLIGTRGFVPTGSGGGFAIVDWRNAPVSRIYYRYEEGDDYEENFGGRPARGSVLVRRTVTVIDGELKRITWPEGSVARRKDGSWVRLAVGEKPMLKGGAGTAVRPPAETEAVDWKRGKLGVVDDENMRDDKRLQAITALIDRHQFDMITKPDAGIVILQGGAGSGKTTVALHRAAYLHFNNPQIFSPKKMAIVVKSPALTEYIARVLPSLGVDGIRCVTLSDWMEKTRKKVLPELKHGRIAEVSSTVARVKKHPAVLHLMEQAVTEEAQAIGEGLVGVVAAPDAKKAVERHWRSHERLALVPRIREMSKWLMSAQATRAGLTAREAADAQGVLRRAKGPAADVLTTWATVLTDYPRLANALEARSPGLITPSELREVVEQVTLQAEEHEAADEDEDEDEQETAAGDKVRQAARRERDEASSALGMRPGHDEGSLVMDDDADEAEDDSLERGIGADGRAIDDDSPRGKLDEHDDALLLRLVQLKQGSLPIPGSQKTISYEHLIVDEAQDLSPTDISVLRGVLTKRESMTLAGDTAQKLIFDNGFDDWKSLLKDLDIEGVELEPLRISYRSTREVTQFARAVLGPLVDPVEPVCPRTGAPVEQFAFGTTGEAMAFIAESLRSLVMREKKASIAVIARYSAQATLYYEGLRNAEVPSLRRIYGKEFSFMPGIDVVDVTQIKGLEYDYVVVVEVGQATFPDQVEARHLLHIAATRAVHQLWVTSVGSPSPLLPDVG